MTKKAKSVEAPADQDEGIGYLSLRLERSQYLRIRQWAFDKHTSMHALAVDAIEKALIAEKR